MPHKALYFIIGACFAIALYTYLLPTNYNMSKYHFQFDIPLWPHGETCAINDDRIACKNCYEKVSIVNNSKTT
jgi:hypothetical protein